MSRKIQQSHKLTILNKMKCEIADSIDNSYWTEKKKSTN